MATLIIDADIPAFRAAMKAQVPTVVHGIWYPIAYEAKAFAFFEDAIETIRTKAEKTLGQSLDVELAFSDSNNFRKQIFPEYKSNRNPDLKPICLGAVKNYAIDYWECVTWENLEADDVCGILGSRSDEYIICSEDKDLLTIPARHYSVKKDSFFTVSEQEADFNFMKQTLSGDVTDGYKGCKGVGDVKAKRLLTGLPTIVEMWSTAKAAFINAGHSEDDALTQARVARILRDGEYEDGYVDLWTPS